MPSITAFAVSATRCRRLAELHRPGEACGIAAADAGEFERNRLVLAEPPVAPHDVRRGRILAAEDGRRQRRDVAGEVRAAGNLRRLDGGDGIAFAHAWRDDLEGPRNRRLGQRRRLAQIGDLGRRFDRADPVHQQIGVVPFRIGQAGDQPGMRLRREIIGFELDADMSGAPALGDDPGRDPVHRMAIGALDMVLGKTNHVLRLHPGRQQAAGRIHGAADPDRLGILFDRNQHHLRRVERPAVIAGDVMLVGDVVDDKQFEPALRHLGADLLAAAAGTRRAQKAIRSSVFPAELWPASPAPA